MIFLTLAAVAIVAAMLHIAIQKQPRTMRMVSSSFALYIFSLPVGLGGLIGFAGHTIRAASVAASIGWPAGNPFQHEVAVANLAFGVLGILCIWFRGGFWRATAIGWGVFLLGAAGVHIHQIIIGQAYAPGNAGAILYFNILLPLLLWSILAIDGRELLDR
jgi:hypothetical protein